MSPKNFKLRNEDIIQHILHKKVKHRLSNSLTAGISYDVVTIALLKNCTVHIFHGSLNLFIHRLTCPWFWTKMFFHETSFYPGKPGHLRLTGEVSGLEEK